MRDGSSRAVAVYDPNELARMPRRHKQLPANEAGELAARVFELLNEGHPVSEIVIRTRETPARIEELREAWLDGGGARLMISKPAKVELERFVGPFATVAELVQRVTDKLGMPVTGTPIAEVIERGQRETIEAVVPEDATDAQLEHAIVSALDAAEATAAP